MSAAAMLFDEQECPSLAKVAPMLEHVEAPGVRKKLLQLDKTLSLMQEKGYDIGAPFRARPATKYTFAEWRIPIKRDGSRCLLSFWVNEVLGITNEKPRKAKAR